MSTRKTYIVLLIVVSLMMVSTSAHAVLMWGTKALGMGTASVGLADDNHAMDINPAGISQGKYFSMGVTYERHEYEMWDFPQWHPELLDQGDDTATFPTYEYNFDDEEEIIGEHEKEYLDLWHASILDARTLNSFAMGIGFTAVNFPSATFEDGQGYQVNLALSGNFGDMFHIGANPKFLQITEDDSMFNCDFGILIRPIQFFSLGIAGHNLFKADIENYINRDITGGIAGHIMEYAQIAFDVTKDFDSDATNTWNFAVGAQGIVLGGLTMRGGFLWDQVNDVDFYSLGIGWTDLKAGGLGYTFRGDVANVRNFAHSLNFMVMF